MGQNLGDKIVEKGKAEAKHVAKKAIGKILGVIAPYIGIFFLCLLTVGVINLVMYILKDSFFSIATAVKNTIKQILTTYDPDNATQNSDAMIAFDEKGRYYINIDDDTYEALVDELKNEQKVDPDTVVTNEDVTLREMVEKYIQAQAMMTCFEDVDTQDNIEGCIRVIRTKIDKKTGELTDGGDSSYELKFLRYAKFMSEYDQQDKDLYSNFTVDPNTFELIIPVQYSYSKYTNEDGYEYEVHGQKYDYNGNETTNKRYELMRIDYQSLIEKYTVSYNFFMSLHLVVQDEKFMNELVDKMIDETEIVLKVIDLPEETTEDYVYTAALDEVTYKHDAKVETEEFDKMKIKTDEAKWSDSRWEEIVDKDENEELNQIDNKVTEKEKNAGVARHLEELKSNYSQDSEANNLKKKTYSANKTVQVEVESANTWWYEYEASIKPKSSTTTIGGETTKIYTDEFEEYTSTNVYPVPTGDEQIDSHLMYVDCYDDNMTIRQKRTSTESLYQTINTTIVKNTEQKKITKNNNKITNLTNLIEKKEYEGVANKIATAGSSIEYQFQQYADTQKWIEIFRIIVDYLNTGDKTKLESEIQDIYINSTDQLSCSQYINQFYNIPVLFSMSDQSSQIKKQTEELNLTTAQQYSLLAMKIIDADSIEEFIKVYKNGLSKYAENSWEHKKYIWENWWSQMANKEIKNINFSYRVDSVYICDKTFETYNTGKYSFSNLDIATIKYYTAEELEKCNLDSSKYELQRTSENEEKIFSGISNIEIGEIDYETYTSKVTGRTYIQYYQNEGYWVNEIKYFDGKPHSLSESGCYATTISIIKSGYKGFDSNDIPSWDNGLNEILYKDYVYGNYNSTTDTYENCKDFNEDDIEIIKDILKSGKEIIVHVSKPNIYTGGEHWMPIVDIDEDNDYLIYLMNTNSLYSEDKRGWVNIYDVFKTVIAYYIVEGVN